VERGGLGKRREVMDEASSGGVRGKVWKVEGNLFI